MLKGDVLTTIQEFVQCNRRITNENARMYTYYLIEYDGTNECKQDIARFIGGFPYGDLTMTIDWLLKQYEDSKDRPDYKTNPFCRKLKECIVHIDIGDWVVWSNDQFFLIPKNNIKTSLNVWNLRKVPFDYDRFRSTYGRSQKEIGIDIYGGTYKKNRVKLFSITNHQ